jgi:hypothetical protein
MGSLLGRLEEREAMTRERIEEIRAQIAAMVERLAGEEDLLSRLMVTKETVLEMLTEGGLFEDGTDRAAGGDAGPPVPVGGGGVIGVVLVPERGEVGDAGVLPPVYREVLDLLAGTEGRLRAKQVCERLAQCEHFHRRDDEGSPRGARAGPWRRHDVGVRGGYSPAAAGATDSDRPHGALRL